MIGIRFASGMFILVGVVSPSPVVRVIVLVVFHPWPWTPLSAAISRSHWVRLGSKRARRQMLPDIKHELQVYWARRVGGNAVETATAMY